MELKQLNGLDPAPTVPMRQGLRRSMRIAYRGTIALRHDSRLQRAAAKRLRASNEVPQEDAWLNDVGPVSQPDPHPQPEMQKSTCRDAMEQGHDQSSPYRSEFQGFTREEYIGRDHRLWSVVLHLSWHIWQEMYQKGDVIPAREPANIEFVRKRALDLLRAELRLANQIHALSEAEQVLKRVVDEVLGYGPLEELLNDEEISEIMVVEPRLVYVERDGKIQEVLNHFEDEQHVLRIIENMLRQVGQHMQATRPLADIRLPDGSLVNIVLPPNAVKGPAITIHTYTKKPLDMADLVALGAMTQEMADFLSACVQARLNIVICGGIGSGRTTLLGAVGSCIPAEERIITIEDIAKLQLSQRHVVPLEARATRPANPDGHLTMRDLVVHALHMRPERVIADECRGSETVEMLQAMYSGYDGSLITMYAQNVRDCLTRLEMMWLVDGEKLPLSMIRARIASSLQLIVQLLRLPDGSRKIMNIAEVQGVDGGRIRMQSVFRYRNSAINGKTNLPGGGFEPSGFRPTFMPKLEARNIHLPDEIFVPRHIS